jgi:hypothetical protein
VLGFELGLVLGFELKLVLGFELGLSGLLNTFVCYHVASGVIKAASILP